MADDQPPNPSPSQVFIDRIDLSKYVQGIDFAKDFDARPFGESFSSGLKPMEPITITGHWIDYSVTCGSCGQSFVPGPEGTPVLTDDETGISITVCPDCVVAIVRVSPD